MAENIQSTDTFVSDNSAVDNSAELGARPTGRVLLITEEAEIGVGAAGLKAVLEVEGHSVAVAAAENARSAVSMSRPDLVMYEVGEPANAMRTCRLLRRQENRMAILAVLKDIGALADWNDLQTAGFDDWVLCDASSSNIESRIAVLLRLAQTGRDLDTARARLARYMQVDEATQLLNRRFFFQNAYREASRARRYGHALACLMIDIDYLDEINKMFGYAGVEYVLRAVAYTVRQWTRDSDICGRFNERKFVVLLPETDLEGALSVRGKILEAMEESRFEWEGQVLPITVSIGEAERKTGSTPPAPDLPEESLTGDTDSEPLSTREELAALLEDADAALNVAKRSNIRPAVFVPYAAN